jgi:hypothetical protein
MSISNSPEVVATDDLEKHTKKKQILWPKTDKYMSFQFFHH